MQVVSAHGCPLEIAPSTGEYIQISTIYLPIAMRSQRGNCPDVHRVDGSFESWQKMLEKTPMYGAKVIKQMRLLMMILTNLHRHRLVLKQHLFNGVSPPVATWH